MRTPGKLVRQQCLRGFESLPARHFHKMPVAENAAGIFIYKPRRSRNATRMSSSYDQLKSILLEKSVRTGEFTLASGKKSDLYIDCRVTALDPIGARLIGELGWAAVQEKIKNDNLDIDAIGGMTMGADPISLTVGITSALQDPAKMIQVFNIRKEPKGHGRGKQIEGNFNPGDTVVVVDDVITTGGSTIQAIDVIEKNGGKVAFALILVDREEGGREAIEARGVPVVSLYSRSSLL